MEPLQTITFDAEAFDSFEHILRKLHGWHVLLTTRTGDEWTVKLLGASDGRVFAHHLREKPVGVTFQLSDIASIHVY